MFEVLRPQLPACGRCHIWEVRVAQPAPSPADRIEQLARDLHRLAFDMREPSRSIDRAERITDEGERITAEVRTVFRGPGIGSFA